MAKRKTKKVERKKLLTLSDLYNFYSSKSENLTFSSAETGYKLAVQVPAQFEINKEQNDDSLLFCLVKLMHSGENRNHSSVTDDALIKASKTLAYKPILANFVEYEDPETNEILVDFTSHDMEITEDGIIYYEHQIGCFTADEPYFEVEENTGHNFLYGYCAIPRSYTDACSIIERKNGTKISVELEINEMQYSASNKVLELTDVTITGATCLGKDAITLNNVEEGMKNARLDIVDFSVENNSIVNYSKTDNEKLIEMLEQLNAKIDNLSNFTIQGNAQSESKEGGNETVTKFEELLSKYGKTVEDITFDYENLSDEELEAKFVEVFEEDNADGEGAEPEPTSDGDDNNDDESDVDSEIEEDDENNSDDNEEEESGIDNDEDNGDDSNDEDLEVEPETDSETQVENTFSKSELFQKLFEISFDEIRYALNALCSIYRTSDEWCYVSQVYEDYFIMEDWDNSKYYKQSYEKDGDNISLSGERIEMFNIMVTESEKIALEEMRSNYASLVQFKADTENAELHSQREAILYDDKYSVLAEKDEDNKYKNEAFAKLVSEMDNYSLTDLEKELKSVFADHITNGGKFAYAGETEVKPTVSKKLFANSTSKKSGRYGNLFKETN